MKFRLAALSINSRPMRTMMALRRVSAPARPMAKSSAESRSQWRMMATGSGSGRGWVREAWCLALGVPGFSSRMAMMTARSRGGQQQPQDLQRQNVLVISCSPICRTVALDGGGQVRVRQAGWTGSLAQHDRTRPVATPTPATQDEKLTAGRASLHASAGWRTRSKSPQRRYRPGSGRSRRTGRRVRYKPARPANATPRHSAQCTRLRRLMAAIAPGQRQHGRMAKRRDYHGQLRNDNRAFVSFPSPSSARPRPGVGKPITTSDHAQNSQPREARRHKTPHGGGQDIDQRHRQHEFPGKIHKLVHAQARQGPAHPDEHADQRKELGEKPKVRGHPVQKRNGACQPPRNNVMARPLTANMPMYSPRKNSANLKPEYSSVIAGDDFGLAFRQVERGAVGSRPGRRSGTE